MESLSNVNIKNRIKQWVVLLVVIGLGVIITKVVEAKKDSEYVKAEMPK